MAKVRRTEYAFLYLEDDYPLDLDVLLGGAVPAFEQDARILALAVLTGERYVLGPAHLDVLRAVPAGRWIDDLALDRDLVRDLTAKGLLLSDADDAALTTLRERDEALAASEWNPYAALFHYMTQWSAVDIRNSEEEEFELIERTRVAARDFVAQHGPPPGEFAEARSSQVLPLPASERDGELYRALVSRRTTRTFDPSVPMTIEQLGTVLKYVFGCHGYARTSTGTVCIKRTSPSGGGLHPIEAYPIVSNVDGVEPGIYHYNARDHSLSLLSALEAEEGRRVATSFMAGQSYFGAAHVSFVLTARFYRNHWKYRRHPKAYAGILMDAAHLSQTLYLVSTELGLGAFITLAINGRDIERRLGLEGIEEGVVAVTGCGCVEQNASSPLELVFSPT